MEEKIKLYLVSGFLGAGKTTFLKGILDGFSAYRVGVLVNEFGSVGVDSKMLQSDDIEVVEINNGSIFCACLKAGFMKTLQAFSKTPIDVLFIENSGLGDPSNMLKLLAEVEPYTERKFDYKGAICVTDCTTYLDYADILPPVENQVRSSNFILVNKTDLVDTDQIESVRLAIKNVNPRAYVYNTCYASLPLEILTEQLFPSEFSGESSNKDWNRPALYTLSSERVVDADGLQNFVSGLMNYAVRVKGFVKSANGFWHVDAAGKQVIIEEQHNLAGDKTQLVLIGKDKTSFESVIRDEWRNAFGEEVVLSVE